MENEPMLIDISEANYLIYSFNFNNVRFHQRKCVEAMSVCARE